MNREEIAATVAKEVGIGYDPESGNIWPLLMRKGMAASVWDALISAKVELAEREQGDMPLVCVHNVLLNFHCTKCKRELDGGNARLVARDAWQRKYEACLQEHNKLRADSELRVKELEAQLARCGKENCMGQDVEGCRRWVSEERLLKETGRVKELSKALRGLVTDPVVNGMSARIAAQARQDGRVIDPFERARAVLSEGAKR